MSLFLFYISIKGMTRLRAWHESHKVSHIFCVDAIFIIRQAIITACDSIPVRVLPQTPLLNSAFFVYLWWIVSIKLDSPANFTPVCVITTVIPTHRPACLRYVSVCTMIPKPIGDPPWKRCYVSIFLQLTVVTKVTRVLIISQTEKEHREINAQEWREDKVNEKFSW